MTILLTLIIFFYLIVGYAHPISSITQDLGRHVLLGKIILSTNDVPKTNLFSYTFPDFPFINHHWLSEVLYFLVFQLGSFQGLLIFTILTAASAFALLFFYAKRRYPPPFIAVISLLYFPILFERTDVRPETFSFLFLSLYLIFLFHFRERPGKYIFFLIPLQLLWTNIHIYFPIGIAVVGLFFLDSVFRNIKILPAFIKKRASLPPHITLLSIVLVAALLSTLLNPNGISGALYPFYVFQNYGYSIEENQHIVFLWQYAQKQTILFFGMTQLVLFAIFILSLPRVRFIDFLLLGFFTPVAALAIRNFPLFVFGTFLSAIHLLFTATETLRPLVKHSLVKRLTTPAIITTFLFLFFVLQSYQRLQLFPLGFTTVKGAENAATFYKENNIRGPLFNNFDIGSYLLYRLYPDEKVFVDGRPEAYPKDFFQKIYIPMQEKKEVFEAIDKQYNFQSIFFSHTDQTPWAQTFLSRILTDPSWHPVYLDDVAIILVKENAQNKDLLQKYSMKGKLLSVSQVDDNDKQSLFRLANFFFKTERTNEEMDVHKKILLLDSSFCPSLYRLSALYSAENPTLASSYAFALQKACQ